MSTTKKCHLIPPDEERCIWMAARVLSYQLCDRKFECDDCPVDAAMRRRYPERTARARGDEVQIAPAAFEEVDRNQYQYSRNHWWLRKTLDGVYRIGIESDLAEALVAVKGVVFPSLAQPLHRGQTCVWVVMDGGTLPLEAPVDGIVRTVNHELVEKPHLLCLQPFTGGWLCELEADEKDAQAAVLMSATEVRSRYASDRARFIAALAGSLRKHPSVGPTLADGGEPLQGFADILGPTRYFALVHQFLVGSRR